MKTFKKKQSFELITYSISYDENNLFNDYYGNERRQQGIVLEEINKLKCDTQNNFLKIGRNLLELLNGNTVGKILDTYLNYEQVKIKRTQAVKYMDAYTYCNKKHKQGQSTEQCVKLGIEKLYLITRLKDTDKQEKLEQFVLNKDLSVKTLNSLVEILNGKNEVMNLAKEFNE